MEAIHGSARGMFESGGMEKETMRGFDARCLVAPSFEAVQIKALPRGQPRQPAGFRPPPEYQPLDCEAVGGRLEKPQRGSAETPVRRAEIRAGSSGVTMCAYLFRCLD